MLMREMKAALTGSARTLKGGFGEFEGQKVFYMYPGDLYRLLSDEDWNKIKDWNAICILPSARNHPNKAFYFNWGYGGQTPEDAITINIKLEDSKW